MAILVTGGAGFIGSHTCVELLNKGEEVVVVDNYYNSKPRAVEAVKKITGKDFKFYEADICDKKALEKIFKENEIDSVIHFAGYKAVAESVMKPLMYYENNVHGTCILLEVMNENNCKKLVFSSSATVYGIPEKVPVTEEFPLYAINPYGNTKLIIEDICRDLCRADDNWSIALLRYFNPIGAHESGLIGDDPNGIPNNLMPNILKAAAEILPQLLICGTDYDTSDGTGVRDYLHVTDLATGHIAAIKYVRHSKGAEAFNLGTGKGYSVLEIVNAFEKVNKIKVPYIVSDRRPGDAAECYSNPEKAERVLGWRAEMDLEQMCSDSWNFAKQIIK